MKCVRCGSNMREMVPSNLCPDCETMIQIKNAVSGYMKENIDRFFDDLAEEKRKLMEEKE